MKIEQVPGKPLRSPPPAAANIAREVHNLIQCVLIAAQVSSSSKRASPSYAIFTRRQASDSKVRLATISCILPRYLPRT